MATEASATRPRSWLPSLSNASASISMCFSMGIVWIHTRCFSNQSHQSLRSNIFLFTQLPCQNIKLNFLGTINHWQLDQKLHTETQVGDSLGSPERKEKERKRYHSNHRSLDSLQPSACTEKAWVSKLLLGITL